MIGILPYLFYSLEMIEGEANDNLAWDLGIRTTIPLSNKAISQKGQPAVLTLLMHTVLG